MTSALWLAAGGGGVIGYLLGRARAELGRARSDGAKAMKSRSAYRRR
ncbi:MAG: hypothetical protein ACRDRL_26705 [Sciscionella sp.]